MNTPPLEVARCAALLTHRSTLCVSQSLADRCAQKQGAFAARIREYEYREVVAANAEGERLIIIDGMVLDVKRWLPEHPGGSKVRTPPCSGKVLVVQPALFFPGKGHTNKL